MAPPDDGCTAASEAAAALSALLASERAYRGSLTELVQQREQLIWKSSNHSSHGGGGRKQRRGSVESLTLDGVAGGGAGSPMMTPSKGFRRSSRRRSLVELSPRSAVAAGCATKAQSDQTLKLHSTQKAPMSCSDCARCSRRRADIALQSH